MFIMRYLTLTQLIWQKNANRYGIEIPIVTTLHGTDITLVGSHPFYNPAVTFSINHSDRVTAVSESLKMTS